MSWEENYGEMCNDNESDKNERRNKMAEALEAKGKVTLKSDNKKSFKIGTDWYSATEKVIPYLEKVNVGDEVEVTYLKNKAFKNVIKLVVVDSPKEEVKETITEAPRKTDGYVAKSYDNAEKTAQIMKGNSLNAAGAAVAGNFQGADPSDIAEALIIIARRGLEYLQE